jgi:sulfite exporter TauE/SafE
MTDLSFISAFLIGVAGSVHCVGMCGGIVGALSFAIPKQQSNYLYILSYNIGRILSYALAGAIVGLLGQLVSHNSLTGITVLQLISGLFLVLLASYIGGWWHGLLLVEKMGKHLWKYISPLSKRFVPFKSPLSALPYGMLWGWLPCGLVYSTLTWALASGSAINGGLIMFAFGLGTLPAMFLMALGFKQIQHIVTHVFFKQSIAISLLLYGLFTIIKALGFSL